MLESTNAQVSLVAVFKVMLGTSSLDTRYMGKTIEEPWSQLYLNTASGYMRQKTEEGLRFNLYLAIHSSVSLQTLQFRHLLKQTLRTIFWFLQFYRFRCFTYCFSLSRLPSTNDDCCRRGAEATILADLYGIASDPSKENVQNRILDSSRSSWRLK